MGAGELAEGIAARRFSASEAVAAHVERQNEMQPKLNAVAVALHDQAMAAERRRSWSPPGVSTTGDDRPLRPG